MTNPELAPLVKVIMNEYYSKKSLVYMPVHQYRVREL
jgi:hypothetical protein